MWESRRRLRRAEGAERAGAGGDAAGAGGDRAGRADLRAARQRVPAAVVGAADRAGRARPGTRRAGSPRAARRRARPGGVHARPRRPARRGRVQRHGACESADDGRGAPRRGRRRRAPAPSSCGCPTTRLQALEVEPWIELPLWLPEASFPGHVAGGHRACAGRRLALPADRRDSRRRVGVAARTAASPSSTPGAPSTGRRRWIWRAKKPFWVPDATVRSFALGPGGGLSRCGHNDVPLNGRQDATSSSAAARRLGVRVGHRPERKCRAGQDQGCRAGQGCGAAVLDQGAHGQRTARRQDPVGDLRRACAQVREAAVRGRRSRSRRRTRPSRRARTARSSSPKAG